MIQESGLFGYVIVVLGLVCVVLAVRGLLGKGDPVRTRTRLLVQGGLALLLGFLGHTLGIFTALSVILERDTIAAQDVRDAMRVSLSPVVLGAIVLLLALVGWAALWPRARRAV